MTKIDKFINMFYTPEITNQYFYTFGYQENYRKMGNKDYGYVPFLNGLDFKEIDEIIPDTNKNNRCGLIKESTEYIVVHDTASGAPSANAKAHSNWLMSMATNPDSTYAVSWHFTVDDSSIYNHLPIDEVGFHAGDGTKTKLEFINTNIKHPNMDSSKPIITISSDGYFLCNGVKTNILAPLDDEGKVLTNKDLPTQGVNYKIIDGIVYIGSTYYNSGYKTISNRGGNLNSVGIETCVNYGSDYVKTMRITAYLVAKLLVHYNLGIDRVKQHNSFSGKDCPMTMRHSNRWEEFINLVSLNLYKMKDLKEHKVEFKSLTKDYLDDSGKVIKHENGKEIKYALYIDEKEYIFTSKLANLTFGESNE